MLNIIKIVDSSLLRTASKINRCYCIKAIKTTLRQQDESQSVKDESNEDKLYELINHVKQRINTTIAIKSDTYSKHQYGDIFIQALSVLALWNKEGNHSYDEVKQSQNYNTLINYVKKNGSTLDVYVIVKALENLKELGANENEPLIQLLEADLLWMVKRTDISRLLKILEYETIDSEIKNEKLIVQQAIDRIELKWIELLVCTDFLRVCNLAKLFSPTFFNHVDERIMDVADQFTIVELSKLFCSYVSIKRRSKPVLRTLSYQMFKKDEVLKPKQIVNTFVAMNIINYPDQALLYKLSKDIISQIDDIRESKLIYSLLFSVGQMRWRDPDLIVSSANWMMKNKHLCRPNHIKNLFLTMAYLSFMPYDMDDFFESLVSPLTASSFDVPGSWVELVWSLVVLGKATTEHIESILDPDFANKFSSDDPAFVGIHFKILNVNAYAKHVLLKSYAGPSLKNTSTENLIVTQNREARSLQIYVNKVLQNIFPPPKYLRMNILTDLGFTVDAEIILDAFKNPIDVEQFTCNFGCGGKVKSSDNRPKGGYKIAVLVLAFKDFTTGSQELTGYNKLAIEILNAIGYKVLLIPHNEVNEKEKIVKCVQYMERKLKDLLES